MKDIMELRQKRAAIAKQMRELLDKADSENRDLTQEEKNQWDKMDAEVNSLKEQIDREERAAELEKEMSQTNGEHRQKLPNQQTSEQRQNPLASPEYRSAYKSYLKYGYNGLLPDERKLIDAGHKIIGPEERALSAVTGAAGGYTVPQGFFNELEQALKDFGGMRQAARIITTATGNDLPMPSVNDTANMGELVAENAAVTSQDIAFGQIIMKAYKYSSKTVLVPIELLQDSAFDVEAEIKALLAERIYRITNQHFTIGNNTDKPQGIVTGATLGKTGATGQTTSVTYDDLIDLEHSIDPAYRRMGCSFMFHDSTLKALKKLKDSQGRPLWLPGLAVKEPDTINSYPYIINQDMPAMAAGAKSILFGALNKYIIRDVMDVTIFRIGEKYIENGQVGFLCFYRTDGRIRDAGTNPIKYYANSAS